MLVVSINKKSNQPIDQNMCLVITIVYFIISYTYKLSSIRSYGIIVLATAHELNSNQTETRWVN